MSERDDELFEAELDRLRPARPPTELMARLVAAQPAPSRHRQPGSVSALQPAPWWRLFGWLAPATVAVAVVVAWLAWRSVGPETGSPDRAVAASTEPALKADDVEIDERLIAAYDAVARMPGGEPVRFRCREWLDEIILRDTARGVVIERRVPRLEIVPVSLEAY